MQLGEMQHFNTTPLGEMQSGEMQFGEMQLSQNKWIININYKVLSKIYNEYVAFRKVASRNMAYKLK